MILQRIYDILEGTSAGGAAGRFFGIFIAALIILNVTAAIVSTEESVYLAHQTFFDWFEIISVTVFTVEYGLRLLVAPCNPRYAGLAGRAHYMASPMAIIDLVAIMPFYLPMFIPIDLRAVRMLRLLRIFRLLKLYRYSDALQTFERVLKDEKASLFIVGFVLLFLLVITSTLMFFVEHEVQPDDFSSIPMAMWWAVATLTTVGYGDVYPVTPLGKLLGGCIAILGIGMFALPAGILASAFGDAIRQKKETRRVCPHCGKFIDDLPEEDRKEV
jgi:voltage-gated potassium channel